jgi:hypothetical protein
MFATLAARPGKRVDRMNPTSTTATKANAADLLRDIRERMASTTDPAKQAELLSLGIDLLRRRQSERPRPPLKVAR